MENRHTGKNGDHTVITFTVAECGEFHSLGEYYEDIGTLEEAAAIYRKIPSGRRNGIPSIGIKIHAAGTGAGRDIQFDILCGSEINAGMARLIPGLCIYEKVMETAEELAGMFPDKEIVDD